MGMRPPESLAYNSRADSARRTAPATRGGRLGPLAEVPRTGVCAPRPAFGLRRPGAVLRGEAGTRDTAARAPLAAAGG
jgi:hypothetical protein